MPEIRDPEVLAFVAEVEAAPALALDAPMAAQRAAYDAMAERFRAPRPGGLAVAEDTLAGPGGPIHRRHYLPEAGGPERLVYCHGGGHTLGGLESHDDVCAEIAAGTGLAVTAVDYRLAPEHPHPAGYEDALAAATAALAEGPVVLVGDSAGGGLAASVAHALAGHPGLLGQVLIYPGLGGEALGLPSYRDCAEAPLLATADVVGFRRLRAGDGVPEGDPTFAVLAAPVPQGVAPAFVSAAEVDPLRDDGPLYAERLRAAGVPARAVVEPELPHMWLRARHRSARAAAAFARVLAAIRALAEGRAP